MKSIIFYSPTIIHDNISVRQNLLASGALPEEIFPFLAEFFLLAVPGLPAFLLKKIIFSQNLSRLADVLNSGLL